ncbi:MAG TPA: UDP-N-acetylglucosamine--N-acetylmuramyl-(pentapeptide) pyrophosphoryl-undecaprenol N-acetylglucosamine transferase [Candidatus Limnocylindrales bacterium]|jgi:UDP-N-acetylglucosamine--N-acetylmuramyl-(pentapeptide) pyrophosphoryl-undecaprenol N-acetylglucosamine transferase
MRLLIAGGGTGGHIYPALAVADALRRRDAEAELAWIGGHRGLEASILHDTGIPLRRLALRSLRTVEADVHLVLDPARLAISVPQAAAMLATDRPAAIFTTGGYVAIPVVLAARPLGIPVLLWEGNVYPGRSTRTIAGLAGAVAVSLGETCRHMPRRLPCFETGTPIRDVRSTSRAAARERLGIPAEAPLVLIFGGSQAVRRFNDAVAGALPELVARVHLLHVTGHDGYAAALAGRERLAPDLRGRYRPEAFLRESMIDALAAADLVVGRAGASTLAEVTALGLPLVVVPYPHAAGHQRANAERLAAQGAARFIEDDAFDAAALLDAVAILDDPAAVEAMRAASRAEGRPGAADAVADLLLAMARREALPSARAIEARSRGVPA